MEPEHGKGTTEPVNKSSGVNNHEDGKISPDFSPASSISSSSSSSSLEFEIDGKEIFDEPVFSPDINTAETPQWSMISASPPIGIEDHLSPSEMKSPPIQTMDHPVGYDPNRIPASVFSTKATNPSEWSVASNESLFSIQMGKSGELPRLDDWNTSPSTMSHSYNVSDAKYCNEGSSSLPLGLPPVMEVSAHEESSETPGKNRRHEKGRDEKMVRGDVAPHHHPCGGESGRPSSARTSTSNPRLSDESGNSSSSFAFPVLVSDGIKTYSLKGVTEKPDQKPQLQAQASKASTHNNKTSTTRWFSWFYCWPRCC